MKYSKNNSIFRLACWLLISAFTLNFNIGFSAAQGANTFSLPEPGKMVTLSDHFEPALIKGVKINVQDPLRFDFLLDRGQKNVSDAEFEEESTRLIRYFLASLTIPEDDLWVNLSPYERERIIPDKFGRTEMGCDLLAQDYLLKQLSASLIYPEGDLGKTFWKNIYREASERFGTTDIPINTFNKVWIVPEMAEVYENKETAMVVESHLKVMLEEDYLALKENRKNAKEEINGLASQDETDVNDFSSDMVREIILPALEKEVNEGEHFARLRQVYHSLILATWYKNKIKETLFEKIYVDQNKVQGVHVDDPAVKQKIYEEYLKAFQKGVYDYIKQDYDPHQDQIITRKYFSGGFGLKGVDRATMITHEPSRIRNLVKHDRAAFVAARIVPEQGIAFAPISPGPRDRAAMASRPHYAGTVFQIPKGGTARAGQEGKATFRIFEIFDIPLTPEEQEDLRAQVLNYPDKGLVLLKKWVVDKAKDGKVEVTLTRDMGSIPEEFIGQKATIGDNAPAILEDARTDSLKAIPQVPKVRMSAAGLFRIKIGNYYLLTFNKNQRTKKGKLVITPIGGAYDFLSLKGRAVYEAAGISMEPEPSKSNTAEEIERRKKEMRQTIDADKVPKFVELFEQGFGREIYPVRELEEETIGDASEEDIFYDLPYYSRLMSFMVDRFRTEQELYQGLRSLVEKKAKEKGVKFDFNLLDQAYKLASENHAKADNAIRDDGRPYVFHVLEIAYYLVKALGVVDQTTVISAIVHDLPEDTPVTLKQIQETFGDQVAATVSDLTEDTSYRKDKEKIYQSKAGPRLTGRLATKIEHLDRVQEASRMAVIAIKTADRLQNLLTNELPANRKQRRMALEEIERWDSFLMNSSVPSILRDELKHFLEWERKHIAEQERQNAIVPEATEVREFILELGAQFGQDIKGMMLNNQQDLYARFFIVPNLPLDGRWIGLPESIQFARELLLRLRRQVSILSAQGKIVEQRKLIAAFNQVGERLEIFINQKEDLVAQIEAERQQAPAPVVGQKLSFSQVTQNQDIMAQLSERDARIVDEILTEKIMELGELNAFRRYAASFGTVDWDGQQLAKIYIDMNEQILPDEGRTIYLRLDKPAVSNGKKKYILKLKGSRPRFEENGDLQPYTGYRGSGGLVFFVENGYMFPVIDRPLTKHGTMEAHKAENEYTIMEESRVGDFTTDDPVLWGSVRVAKNEEASFIVSALGKSGDLRLHYESRGSIYAYDNAKDEMTKLSEETLMDVMKKMGLAFRGFHDEGRMHQFSGPNNIGLDFDEATGTYDVVLRDLDAGKKIPQTVKQAAEYRFVDIERILYDLGFVENGDVWHKQFLSGYFHDLDQAEVDEIVAEVGSRNFLSMLGQLVDRIARIELSTEDQIRARVPKPEFEDDTIEMSILNFPAENLQDVTIPNPFKTLLTKLQKVEAIANPEKLFDSKRLLRPETEQEFEVELDPAIDEVRSFVLKVGRALGEEVGSALFRVNQDLYARFFVVPHMTDAEEWSDAKAAVQSVEEMVRRIAQEIRFTEKRQDSDQAGSYIETLTHAADKLQAFAKDRATMNEDQKFEFLFSRGDPDAPVMRDFGAPEGAKVLKRLDKTGLRRLTKRFIEAKSKIKGAAAQPVQESDIEYFGEGANTVIMRAGESAYRVPKLYVSEFVDQQKVDMRTFQDLHEFGLAPAFIQKLGINYPDSVTGDYYDILEVQFVHEAQGISQREKIDHYKSFITRLLQNDYHMMDLSPDNIVIGTVADNPMVQPYVIDVSFVKYKANDWSKKQMALDMAYNIYFNRRARWTPQERLALVDFLDKEYDLGFEAKRKAIDPNKVWETVVDQGFFDDQVVRITMTDDSSVSATLDLTEFDRLMLTFSLHQPQDYWYPRKLSFQEWNSGKERRLEFAKIKSVTKDAGALNHVGGIDLNDLNLLVKKDGQGVEFSIDPASLERLSQNLTGFSPEIIYIEPLKDSEADVFRFAGI